MGEGKSERINDKRISDCINGGACGDVYLGGKHSQEKYGINAAKLPNDGMSTDTMLAMFGN